MGTGVSPKRISTKQEWTNFFQKFANVPTNFRRKLLSVGKFMWGFLTEHEVRSETNQTVYEKFIWILLLYGFLRHRIAIENFSSKSKLFELSSIHQKSNNTQTPTLSLERRWSSRTFRYGYLVTTSPQSSVLPSAASSLGTLTSGITNSHGVTGGVYKTRERIHRSMLICDY